MPKESRRVEFIKLLVESEITSSGIVWETELRVPVC